MKTFAVTMGLGWRLRLSEALRRAGKFEGCEGGTTLITGYVRVDAQETAETVENTVRKLLLCDVWMEVEDVTDAEDES